jgi:excisionase family DNA binding protein
MNSHIRTLFDEYCSVTGCPEAAATLVLAEVQAAEQPTSDSSPRDRLLHVKEAAQYLGYDAAGLRKLVKQKRITYVQNGRGPIKFRREWLDDFIRQNKGGPKDIERSPAQKRRAIPITESRFGLDPKPFRSRNRVA